MPPLPPQPPAPPTPPVFSGPAIAPRSPEQQSWSAVISIVIIVAMIVVGAFYSWGKRIAEQRALTEPPATAATQ